MAVLDGDHVLYIAHVPSNRRIRFTGSVGSRSPAYATSLGLVLWAHLSEEGLEERLSRAPFSAYTSQTLTQAEQMRIAVRTARERGYATAQEQLDYGIVAIAISIRDSHGQVIASINCSSELTRNDRETSIASRLEPMRDTARQIEHGLKRFPLWHTPWGAEQINKQGLRQTISLSPSANHSTAERCMGYRLLERFDRSSFTLLGALPMKLHRRSIIRASPIRV